MQTTLVQVGYTIQIPAAWVAELGLGACVILEKTAEGILVRPCGPDTWDDIFAEKLPMGQRPLGLDLSEVSGDDVLL
jgi:hypothetical protein